MSLSDLHRLVASAPPPDDVSPFRTSPIALVLAGLLLLVAVYYLIRLLEWDLVNKETEDQEDPLLK